MTVSGLRPGKWLLVVAGIVCSIAPVAGCVGVGGDEASSTHAPFWLSIANLDGPTVSVEINGRSVGTFRCQLEDASGAPPLTVTADLPLPWIVRVLRPNGSQMGVFYESGDIGSRTILIRGDQAGEFASEEASGGPVPSGACWPG